MLPVTYNTSRFCGCCEPINTCTTVYILQASCSAQQQWKHKSGRTIIVGIMSSSFERLETAAHSADSSCCDSVLDKCKRKKNYKPRTVIIGKAQPKGTKYPRNAVRNQKYSVITFIPLVSMVIAGVCTLNEWLNSEIVVCCCHCITWLWRSDSYKGVLQLYLGLN